MDNLSLLLDAAPEPVISGSTFTNLFTGAICCIIPVVLIVVVAAVVIIIVCVTKSKKKKKAAEAEPAGTATEVTDSNQDNE